ncbi:MAG: hypothetical protein ACPGNV_05260 [Mangrovicoccus sp.]
MFFGIIVMTGPVFAILLSPPVPGDAMLVISFSATTTIADLVAQAGGQLVGPAKAPFAALAISDLPQFAEQLRLAGAVAVADGAALLELCGV